MSPRPKSGEVGEPKVTMFLGGFKTNHKKTTTQNSTKIVAGPPRTPRWQLRVDLDLLQGPVVLLEDSPSLGCHKALWRVLALASHPPHTRPWDEVVVLMAEEEERISYVYCSSSTWSSSLAVLFGQRERRQVTGDRQAQRLMNVTVSWGNARMHT